MSCCSPALFRCLQSGQHGYSSGVSSLVAAARDRGGGLRTGSGGGGVASADLFGGIGGGDDPPSSFVRVAAAVFSVCSGVET
ncbi:MAG: hypothetical protein IJT70_05710 [Clostridia bacterium]|nr:hypothetical protein [Clostridia bacterium]